MIHKWIQYYSWKYMIDDTLGGLSLSTIVIPQSLAYSQLAKLPAVYGLYVSIIPSLVYTILGNHPYTSIGTAAIISIVISESLASISIAPEDYAGFASFLALIVGGAELLLVAFGIIDILSKYLFKPSFISGFTVASVITIITSQLKSFFGLQFASPNGFFSAPKTWYLVVCNITQTNIATLTLSVSTIVLIIGSEFTETFIRKWLRRRRFIKSQSRSNQQNKVQNQPRETHESEQDDDSIIISYEDNPDEKIMNVFPAILFAVILLTFVSKLMNLPGNYGVATIGNIPSGFPPFSLPWLVLSRTNKDAMFLTGQIIYRVLSLVIVCTVTSASLMDLYPGSNPDKENSHLSLHLLNSDERRDKQEVKKGSSLSQEVFALSIAGILGSFFTCYTPCASLSKGAILSKQTNVKSTLWNSFTAVFVILAVFFLSDFFQNIPLGILAAIILVAISSSAKNIRIIVTLFKKAITDYKVFKENLKSPNATLPEPSNIIISRQGTPSNPGNVFATLEIPDIVIEPAPETDTTQPSSRPRPHQNNSILVPYAESQAAECGAIDPLVQKVSYSLKICGCVTIWSDVVIWLVTFFTVLLIDVSAGIYAGTILIILLYALRAISKP